MAKHIIFGAALAAALMLGGAQSALAQRKGGDVVIGISQAPPSLDAQITSAQASRNAACSRASRASTRRLAW